MIGRSEDGKTLRIQIGPDAVRMTIERYLRQRMGFTKAQISSMKYRENGIRVNGERSRVTYVLQAGELLELQLEDERRASDHLAETEGEIEMIYEDKDLIAVWKEAGMVLHPSHGHYQDTLTNRLHAYFRKKKEHVTIRSIGRLDRDTEGIVVFAKNQVAAARLWKQKEEGVFWKEYLAVCRGRLEQDLAETELPDRSNGRNSECAQSLLDWTDRLHEKIDAKLWHTIDVPIGHLPGDLMKMCVTPDGKPAVTHYQVLSTAQAEKLNCPIRVKDGDSLIRVRIDTGRTHQIRVHMAHIGHPLVGDMLYGEMSSEYRPYKEDTVIVNSESEPGTRHVSCQRCSDETQISMHLIAWRTELRQPFTGELLRLCRV